MPKRKILLQCFLIGLISESNRREKIKYQNKRIKIPLFSYFLLFLLSFSAFSALLRCFLFISAGTDVRGGAYGVARAALELGRSRNVWRLVGPRGSCGAHAEYLGFLQLGWALG